MKKLVLLFMLPYFAFSQVGIGTTSPISTFANTSIAVQGSNSTNAFTGGFTWSTEGTGFAGSFFSQPATGNGLQVKIAGSTSVNNAFEVSTGTQSGVCNPLFNILGNGNVGIGKSVPDFPLEVMGSNALTALAIGNKSLGSSFRGKISAEGSGANDRWMKFNSDWGAVSNGTRCFGFFRGNSNEYLTILDNGNIGINTGTTINNKFEVNQGTSGNSGIRTTQMNSSTISASPLNVAPIGVNSSGDIVRVSSLQASITSSLTSSTLVTPTPTAIPFNADDNLPFGTITHSTTVNNSRFTVTKTGKYIVFAQPQIERISTASSDCVFWVRINGTIAVPNSAIRYNPNNNNVNIVVPLSITLDLVANDYFEIMCQANDINTYRMTNTSGSGSGATQIPNTPACILDVKGFYN